jgi:hypothetical protein
MRQPTLKALSPALTLLLIAASQAQQPAAEFRQEAKHVHGAVTLNLAIEGKSLAVELEAPAINVVGFERAPRTAEERAAVSAAAAWLFSGAGLIGVPKAAGCRRDSANLEVPDWSKSSDNREHSHDHDHDHDHEHEHESDQDHADYRASIRYTCSNPAALAWVEVWGLRKLREVSAMNVNIVTTTSQKSVTTVKPDERIALR